MSIEQRINQLLAPGETLELWIQQNKGAFSKLVLIITSERAMLVRASFANRMQDISDKQWRQLIDVHVKEHFFSSTLFISFFKYPDSITYPDSHTDHLPAESIWEITNLDKKEARAVYRCLKKKEQIWKEKRRQEHIEHDRAMGERYFEMRPPQRDDETK